MSSFDSHPDTTHPLASTVTSPDKARLLEMVAAASAAFESARETLRNAVHDALDDGATWSEIGRTLGVSRQAAFERFGPKHGRTPEA